MNELEKKLGLIELTPVERVFKVPTEYNLKAVPKIKQTYEMLKFVCKKDGLALEHASKKLITFELCEIAASQNGLALEYVPVKIIKEQGADWYKSLCERAVVSNGMALRFVPDDLKNERIIELALLKGELQIDRIFEWTKFPIAYAPVSLLTNDLLKKTVERTPLCIKDIPKKKVTKAVSKVAVEGNGLALQYVPTRFINKDIVLLAISGNEMAIRYAPIEYLTQEICDECFERNPAVLAYLPIKYITKEMCLKAIKQKRFSVSELSEETMVELFGSSDIDLVLFDDIPEKLRNDRDVLQSIIEMDKYGSLHLIKWNEQVIESKEEGLGLRTDKRNNEIKPFRKRTLDYLQTKTIEEPVEENEIALNLNEHSFECIHNSELPLQKDVPEPYSIIPRHKNALVSHDFSEEVNVCNIYYVSDIHIEHQLSKIAKKIKNKPQDIQEQSILEAIRHKVNEMISDINDWDSVLLIGGDVADSPSLSAVFYAELSKQWGGGTIISVLGNHELWDGTNPTDWENPNFVSRPIDVIVEDYRRIISNFYVELLENALYIQYKDRFSKVIPEEEIINASDADLKDLLSKCTFIVLGGIGYSGLNSVYNASLGLYRRAIESVEEDIYRTEKFRRVYDKVKRCAENRKVIVLTHTPVYDWTSDSCNPNWIYVNGHTHKNALTISEDGTTVLSDNQIGYKPQKWKLNSFTIDSQWYDPFETYEDGIYEITSDEYKEFNRGRSIRCNGCAYAGKLYMLKRDKMYMFLLESARSLCLMAGGQRKRLANSNIHYYYDNLQRYSEGIRKIIAPYQKGMQQLSEEVKKIGGSGHIHGCIVDIGFFSHIYVNPFDGKIMPYWALDMLSRKSYPNVQKLLEKEEPDLWAKFLIESEKKAIPLIGKQASNKESKSELAVIPQWVSGTEMYEPSRIMKAIQFVWEQNVIRIWNDDVLRKDGRSKPLMIE
ncbi:MAG: hypothetical protein HDR08_09060 [Lachnospiraceae bacterium]|nr:hypothetical protein [Lachnospiraceae bacterium]